MTITVVSTSEPETVAQPIVESSGAPKVEGGAVEQSAPESKDTEHKSSAKSDTAETEAEEIETDESDSESEKDQDGNDAKDKPRKKGGFQRRIDKLNARNSAAQAEIEHWKSMALKSAGDKKEPEQVENTVSKAEIAGKPIPDSFDTHAEYVEALTDWKIEQRVKEAKEQAEKTRIQTEQETLMKTHSQRVKTFATKTKDFQDVLESVDDVPVSPTVRELIVSSDNGPELMYELAKNREEFERINKLTPLAAARELGKIEVRLSVKEETKQEPKKITKAPQPITPIGGKGAPVEKSIDDPNLSQKEYEVLRAKQRSAS